MLSNLKNTLKHSVIYSLGNLSTKVIGLILLPLYTSYLGTEEYGMLAILETTSQFLVAVVGMRLSTAMMRWWSDAKSSEEKGKIIFTTAISTLIIVLVFLTAVVPFNKDCSRLFFGSTVYASYFIILFVSIALEIFASVAMSLVRLKEKSILFIIVNSIKLTVGLLLNIYFIVYKGWGVKGIIFSLMIGHCISLLLTLPILIKNSFPHFKYNIFRELVKFSFPLSLTTITMLLLTLSDRYIIKYYHNYSDVGVYSLGYKLAGVINVFILQSFQMGFLPIAYKMYDKPDANRFFSKVLTYFMIVLILSALVLSLFAKEVIVLFAKSNHNYWQAYTIVPILCLTYTLKGLEYFLMLGLHYVKKTKYNALVVLIGSVFSLSLNFVLIPFMNIYGAAATAFLSELLLIILFYRYSIKFYHVDYEIFKIVKLFIIAISIFTITYFIQHINIFVRISLKLFFLASFPFILYYWNFFETIEIIRLKQAWQKWKNPLNWKNNIKNIKLH